MLSKQCGTAYLLYRLLVSNVWDSSSPAAGFSQYAVLPAYTPYFCRSLRCCNSPSIIVRSCLLLLLSTISKLPGPGNRKIQEELFIAAIDKSKSCFDAIENPFSMVNKKRYRHLPNAGISFFMLQENFFLAA